MSARDLLRFAGIMAVLGVTAYAVFWLDRSAWFFLLALVIASIVWDSI